MSQRKTPLLAYCEYVSPDLDNSTQVWRARCELIETAKRVYPRFIEKLLAEVFPLYCDLANVGYDLENILWGPPGVSPFELLPEHSGIKSALHKWAAEFNVQRAGWLVDEALRTLRFWYVAPEKRGSLEWFEMHLVSISASMGERITFECEGWETELLTWSQYSQSVRQRFEEALSDYENQTRGLAESRGLVRARTKFSPDNLEWFVLYQFAGLSSTEIAKHSKRVNSIDESTILKGIKAAARLIGWGQLRTMRDTRNRKIR